MNCQATPDKAALSPRDATLEGLGSFDGHQARLTITFDLCQLTPDRLKEAISLHEALDDDETTHECFVSCVDVDAGGSDSHRAPADVQFGPGELQDLAEKTRGQSQTQPAHVRQMQLPGRYVIAANRENAEVGSLMQGRNRAADRRVDGRRMIRRYVSALDSKCRIDKGFQR